MARVAWGSQGSVLVGSAGLAGGRQRGALWPALWTWLQ